MSENDQMWVESIENGKTCIEATPKCLDILNAARDRIANAPEDLKILWRLSHFFGWIHTVLQTRYKHKNHYKKYRPEWYYKEILYQIEAFKKEIEPLIKKRSDEYKVKENGK